MNHPGPVEKSGIRLWTKSTIENATVCDFQVLALSFTVMPLE